VNFGTQPLPQLFTCGFMHFYHEKWHVGYADALPKEEKKMLQGRKAFLQLAQKKCSIIGVIVELLQEASTSSAKKSHL